MKRQMFFLKHINETVHEFCSASFLINATSYHKKARNLNLPACNRLAALRRKHTIHNQANQFFLGGNMRKLFLWQFYGSKKCLVIVFQMTFEHNKVMFK